MTATSMFSACRQRRRRVWRFRRGPGEFVISGCIAPYPPLWKENSHRIFTFCVDPTGQLRGSGPLDPPGQLRRCLSVYFLWFNSINASVENTWKGRGIWRGLKSAWTLNWMCLRTVSSGWRSTHSWWSDNDRIECSDRSGNVPRTIRRYSASQVARATRVAANWSPGY